MKIRLLKEFCVLCLLAVTSGCFQANSLSSNKVQDICKPMQEFSPGQTWLEITPGVSTEADLLELHGDPISKETHNRYLQCENIYWLSFDKNTKFLIIDHLVHAIAWTPFSQSSTTNLSDIGDFVHLHGRPDLIGWSELGANYRVLVWFEGVNIDVTFDQEKNPIITNVLFFSSLTTQILDEPIAKQYFLDEKPDFFDVIDALEKDPFDWSKY